MHPAHRRVLTFATLVLLTSSRQPVSAQTTERVSVASDGTQANGGSTNATISADGRFVAYIGFASNLVAGDTNGFFDVFVHDRQTGTTERVSVASDGTQANCLSFRPAISADGRFVAFESCATNLVASDTNGTQDVFVHVRTPATYSTSTSTSSTTSTTRVTTTTTTTTVTSTTSPTPPTTTTTTTTTLPCTTVRCTLGAALMSPACAGQAIPASVTGKLSTAENLIEQAATTPAKKAGRVRQKARNLLRRAGAKATRAAKGKKANLSAGCGAALQQAANSVRSGLGSQVR